MRIDKISTIQLPEHPHLLWVQIHTDEGIVGTGETTPRVGAVKRVIHDTLSGILLGRDPRQVERLWHEMFHALHYHGYAGSEFRALSAVDLALWDIVGQIAVSRSTACWVVSAATGAHLQYLRQLRRHPGSGGLSSLPGRVGRIPRRRGDRGDEDLTL